MIVGKQMWRVTPLLRSCLNSAGNSIWNIKTLYWSTILAEYFGKHDKELQIAAKELTEVGRTLHLCIMNVLILLSKSLPDDEYTRNGVVLNCFLVPEYN